MKYHSTIQIPQKELDEMNTILLNELNPNIKENDVIKTYTANFSEPNQEIKVDIKVINGDTPYVDPVLFDDGSSLTMIDVRDQLDGEYVFNINADQFVVTIVAM